MRTKIARKKPGAEKSHSQRISGAQIRTARREDAAPALAARRSAPPRSPPNPPNPKTEMSPIDESLRRLRETDEESKEREESEQLRRAAWYVLA